MTNTDKEEPPVTTSSHLEPHLDNIAQLSEILRNSRSTFFAIILASVYTYLTISTTTDAALLANSNATPLPIIQVKVPIVWFFYMAPIILTVLFIYFHLYLERFWYCIVRLPLHHPDGRGLDDYVYPWLISSAFIRGGVPQLSRHKASDRLQMLFSLILGWWLIPIVLMFYWARYLVVHEWAGTLLHVTLILITVAFALRFVHTAKNSMRKISLKAMQNSVENEPEGERQERSYFMQILSGGIGLACLATLLIYLSASAILGTAEDICIMEEPQNRCSYYTFGRSFWLHFSFLPDYQINKEKFASKPKDWLELLHNRTALQNYLEGQRPLLLKQRNLRNMKAQGAFMPGIQIQSTNLEFVDFTKTVMTGAQLTNVTLKGTHLNSTDLQYAKIIDAQFENVYAENINFNNASFQTLNTPTQVRGDFSTANFNNATGSSLLFGSPNAELDKTVFKFAKLIGTNFNWSTFSNVDLNNVRIDDARLQYNTFINVDFTQMVITDTIFDGSTFTDSYFSGVTIKDVTFEDTEFTNVDISQTLVDKPLEGFSGQDMRFNKGSINKVKFVGALLQGAKFAEVSFENTLFIDSDLSGSTFKNVDMDGVQFINVDLTGADLKHALNVTPALLLEACGNKDTKLPRGLTIKPCIEGY